MAKVVASEAFAGVADHVLTALLQGTFDGEWLLTVAVEINLPPVDLAALFTGSLQGALPPCFPDLGTAASWTTAKATAWCALEARAVG